MNSQKTVEQTSNDFDDKYKKTDRKLNKRTLILLSIVGLTLCCAVYGVTSGTNSTTFLQTSTLVGADENVKAAIEMH